jgi:creatinine amidohydrolase
VKTNFASIALTDMNWQEFARKMSGSTIALCVGSVEQHGPHLPLSVDLLIPYHLALALGEREPVLVAPPIHYGYRSQPATGGGQSFPGTTSLSGQTLTLLVKDILVDFVRQGCKHFLLMNGHFENTSFIGEAAHLVTTAHPGVKVVIVNWWDLVTETTLNSLFPEGFPGWEVEHASLVETSLIMYFRPDLVHPERIPAQKGQKHQPRPLVFPEPAGLVPESGILYSAEGASADKGAAIVQELVSRIQEIVTAEFPRSRMG